MKRLLLSVLLLSPPAFGSDIVQRLTEKEAQLEQLYAEYWRAEYKNASGDKQASSLPVQEKIRRLVADEQFLNELAKERFTDPLLRRRQQLWLWEGAHTFIYTDPELARLTEAMGNHEAEISYEFAGKKVKRSELNNLIAHEPDRELRRQAWLARAQNDKAVGARIAQAMKLRKRLAAKYAGGDYVGFMLARKGVPERKRLESIFDDFIAKTEPEYQRLLARMKRDLKVEKVEPWDVDYFFSSLVGDFEPKKFPRDDAWPRIKKVALALGYDFDNLPVDTVITEITFGGGTYPILYNQEIRILVNKYEGLRFTDTLFHEAGHALHYSFMADPTFILKGSSSEPFDEGCGQIMALLLYRKPIATRTFGLTDDEFEKMNERYRLRTLLDTRDTIAEARFEYAAYEDPDQDLAALYNRFESQVTGFDMHGARVWAFNPFYSTGPIYLQSYAVAEMAARQIHADLERRFGPVWGKEAGDYLRRKYFSISGRLTLDEILQQGTGRPLSARDLINYSNGPVAKPKK